jgi:hypothetical protein
VRQRLKARIKNPIWDKVLKAIIFLKSISAKELKPAIKTVKILNKNINSKNKYCSNKKKYRKIMKTPAVTRVLL